MRGAVLEASRALPHFFSPRVAAGGGSAVTHFVDGKTEAQGDEVRGLRIHGCSAADQA